METPQALIGLPELDRPGRRLAPDEQTVPVTLCRELLVDLRRLTRRIDELSEELR